MLLLTCLVLSLSAADTATLEFSRVAMGDRVRVVVQPAADDADSRDKAKAAVELAFQRLEALESALSDWRLASEITRVSDAAGGDWVAIGPDLAAALTRSRELASATDGLFDPTVGPVSRLWREAREKGALPDDAAVNAARSLIDWRLLELQPASPGEPAKARLSKPGMRLELGAVGKGIAVDELSALLEAHDLPVHLIDFGSALRAGDAPSGRSAWKVDAPGFGTIELCRAALAVSGTSEQVVKVEGAEASHLIDPRPEGKGLGLAGSVKAAVIGPTGAVADALATALCVAGPRRAQPLAARFGLYEVSVEGPGPRGRSERFATPGFAEGGLRCGQSWAELHPLRRVALPGNRAVLEVAAMRFVAEDLPTVTLVGVTHIGEQSFYEALQALFDSKDLVLYESVMPRSVMGVGQVPPEERAARTREAMTLLAELLEAVRLKSRDLPAELPHLAESMREVDTRFVRLVPNLTRDAWGREILYERRFDDRGEAIDFELRSLGADGACGGRGDAADIVLKRPSSSSLAEEGLQAKLADALGLRFQLRAIDYSKPNFVLADMNLAEVKESLEARGLDDGGLLGTLAGSSFSGRMATMLLGLLKLADGLLGGTLREMIKAVLLELFADGEILGAAEQQMGKGFMEVIVVERNIAALEGLRDVPPTASVAVFYGAAHLPDMALRLEEAGYRLDEVTWFPAIEADLAKAGLDQRQLATLRRDIRAALRGRGKP